jgi:tRNA(adenine34) deaminase
MSELAERRLERDQRWIEAALVLAEQARLAGEVPVGAILVRNEVEIARAHNLTYRLNDPSAHAEILALRDAGRALGSPRLDRCTLYVTLEPCAMCAGAILHARVERLVYAASDPLAGGCGGRLDVLRDAAHNHRVEVSAGLFGDRARRQLEAFFSERR